MKHTQKGKTVNVISIVLAAALFLVTLNLNIKRDTDNLKEKLINEEIVLICNVDHRLEIIDPSDLHKYSKDLETFEIKSKGKKVTNCHTHDAKEVKDLLGQPELKKIILQNPAIFKGLLHKSCAQRHRHRTEP